MRSETESYFWADLIPRLFLFINLELQENPVNLLADQLVPSQMTLSEMMSVMKKFSGTKA
jgi:hypothetical protein